MHDGHGTNAFAVAAAVVLAVAAAVVFAVAVASVPACRNRDTFVKQMRYRALAVYIYLIGYTESLYADSMPLAKPKNLEELVAQRKAIKDSASAEIAALKKAAAERLAALNAPERRLRAKDVQDRKRRENHAKILVGVAMIHQCHASEASASKFKALLEEFYSDSPERLKAAQFGLSLVVKKPANDAEQD